MKKLLEFSIRQPLIVSLFTIFLIAVGFISLWRLNRDMFPNVQLDLVIVTAAYPGATPQEVEKNVTIPIEKELKEVDHIKKMHSFSGENSSVMILEIEPDAPDKGKIFNNIQRAVDRTEDLPEGLDDKPMVTEMDATLRPIVEVSISGDMSEFDLIKHARNLETIFLLEPDIASITRRAWRDEEVWVEIEPEAMSKYYLSLAELINVLKKHNVSIPGGNIIVDGKEVLLRTVGEIQDVETAKNIAVRGSDAGGYIRLQDVAAVKRGFAPAKIIQKTDGKKSINLVIIKRDSTDAINLVSGVKDLTDKYKRNHPEVNLQLVNDNSYYIKRRLNVLTNNGAVGVLLVIITIFIFMSFRGAFVTAIGIPLAFLTTFIIMDMFSITINLITMFGLIIVLGMIVDDGIVVAENIYRKREEGMSAPQAALQGALEVWRPVTAAVLTTIAAFTPLMFMSGMIGKFVKYIPIVIIIALCASLFEVFIILPSHMVELEKLPKGKFSFKRHWLDTIKNKYKKMLTRVIKHRYIAGGSFLGLLVISGIIFFMIPFILFPAKGIEAFFVRARAPMGMPLEQTAELMRPVERIVNTISDKEIKNFITHVGVINDNPNDPFGETASHVGQITVYLTPITDRDRDTIEVMDEVRNKLKDVRGFDELTVDSVRPGPPVGKSIEINISGDRLYDLKAMGTEVKSFLQNRKGVKDVQMDLRPGKEERVITLNEEMAARAGITVEDIALSVRAAFEGIRATTFRRGDEEIYIRVRLPEAQEQVPGALSELLIPTKTGQLVPLKNIAIIEEGEGLSRIRHYKRRRTVLISANIDERKTTSITENNAVLDKFKDKIEKQGYVMSLGGEWEETKLSVNNLIFAFLGALMMIFLILAFQFQSLIQPLIVMVAIPYGFIGVSIAFLIHVEPKSFLAMLGAVGLAGVVVNDSIVMVDFINRKVKEGGDRIQAVVDASAVRLRPVVLTTFTTVFGLLPVAYGILGYDPFLRPMALAMGWGLVVATSLTLFFTPCLYAITDDVRHYWRQKTPHIGKILNKNSVKSDS